jgi:transposase InsO family protein
MLAVCLWLWLFRTLPPRPRNVSRGRCFVPAALPCLRPRKPDWAVEEVIRLKALMSDAGCRRIADTFNRLHAARHRTTVSKTWVAVTVRRHRLEIEERRREWKRRIPSPMPANRIWGIDLTGKMDSAGVVHPILGIVDHGSRLAVSLRLLPDKATIAILRALLDAIERFGKPRAVRTDNEAVFT